jgi:hypothetical protein
MEMTAPYKPQMNGVVERSLVTARNRAFAMMISASSFQNRPWAEAVHTAPKNGNILHSSRLPVSPHMMFFGVESKIIAFLKPFSLELLTSLIAPTSIVNFLQNLESVLLFLTFIFAN